MKRPNILWCAAIATACANLAPPSAAVEQLCAARQAAADADAAALADALTQLDAIARDCREYAPYHALCGEMTWKLAAKTRDAGKKGADFMFEDAVRALRKAVELDGEPTAPRLLLARALYDSNQLEAAAATSTALLLHLEAHDGGSVEDLAAVHALRANAAARAYAAKKAENRDDAELLTAARTSFRLLEQQGRLDADLRKLWSVTEQWAGAPTEAVAVHARAARQRPEDQEILDALVEVAAAQKQLPAALAALQARSDATGLWYLGRVRYLMADVERESKRTPEALGTLDAAMQCFSASAEKNPAYRDSCERWRTMCLGKKGNIAFLAGDLPNAEAWLLDATRRHPDLVTADLGLSETTKLGLLRVGDRYMRDFKKTEAFFRVAAEAVGSDVDLLNNAAVYARDRGNQLERAGKADEARELYERSYATYHRAVLLDPTNVRLRNDCALVAIYHLERDWDLARQLLEGAIADGERTLRSPPQEERVRQDLDEAVGDCLENLALWHLKHTRDASAARAAAQQSLQHFPSERRAGAQRHLEAVNQLLAK